MMVSITSGKGGTGKSTLASNLSYIYSTQEKHIQLVDIDWGMSNSFYFFNVHPTYSIHDYLLGIKPWDEIGININSYFKLIIAGQGVDDMANISDDYKTLIKNQLQHDNKSNDMIILDTSPGIHRNVTDFLYISDHVIVVVTSSLSAIADGYQLIKTIVEGKVKGKIHVVVNQVSDPNKAYDIFSRMYSTCKKYLNLEINYLGNVNNSTNMEKALASQKIFVNEYKGTQAARQINTIGNNLWMQKTKQGS